MDETIEGLLAAIEQGIEKASTTAQLEEVRVAFIGRKGQLTRAMKDLSELSPEERPRQGKRLNQLRQVFDSLYEARHRRLAAEEEDAQLAEERLDMTLPGRNPLPARLHPVTRVTRMLEEVFLRMGFSLATGPEIETVWYNFEALNVAEDHPARAMQDSFFVDLPGYVMRTQTSPMQIRAMEEARGRVPLRIISTGRVYRRDEDATHIPMFTQLEALAIDRHLGLADLKGVLLTLAREIFGASTEIRLRPSYFPFTEPSLEVDISCVVCGGKGCRTCKDGWLEILGSGMVHPVVLRNGGYDPDHVNGFALGLGIERVVMLLYGFDDIRLLYQNDLGVLSGFGDPLAPMGSQEGPLL